MIDKNGKLFGRINIIDLSIIILLLAAALFVIYRADVFSPENTAASEDKILLTMYQEEAPAFAASNVKLGDPVSESFKNVSFGSVVSVETDNPVNWGADDEGNQIETQRDGYSSLTLKMEAPGKSGPSGLTIGGVKYYVGQILVIRVGTSTFYARIESAEQINE